MQEEKDDVAILEEIKHKEYVAKRKSIVLTSVLIGCAVIIAVIAIVGLTVAIEDNKD